MPESRVGSLDLRVRAPADRLPHVAAASQAFAASVLRRCDELLERRAPGRIIVLPRLDLSLRLIDGALDHDGEIDAFASEIAGAIERQAAAASERTSGEPEIAVFEDEVAWRAAHLEATARGAGAAAWPFDALDAEGEPMTTLLDGDRQPLLREILSRLYSRGTLIEVLQALPDYVVELLARTLGARRAESGSPDDGREPLPASLEAFLRTVTGISSASVASIAASVAALSELGSSAGEAAIERVAGTLLAGMRTGRRERADGRALAKPGSAVSESGPGIRRLPADRGVETRLGGLFYLLQLAVELGLGEMLWRACLPEGAILTSAVQLLAEPTAKEISPDPAPFLFGGVRDEGRHLLVSVEPPQQEEIATDLLLAVVEALPRRGLAALPEPYLRLHDTPEGRLLSASAEASSFSLFTFAARSPEETGRALEKFLALWPASGPAPRSGFALAGLDRRSRVRPLRRLPDVSPAVPGGGPLPERALLAQVAGSLAHLFAARVGMPAPWNPARLAARLSIPARLFSSDDELVIRIPMERIDLDARRAGLDADPGWVPWLGKPARFVFTEEKSEPE